MPAQASGMAVMSACGLAAGYTSPRRVVVGGVNVDVARGELICLIGPNGAGKSSLLRTLAHLQPPLRGSVAIEGRPVAALTANALARRVALVLAGSDVPANLRAREVVALGRFPHQGWWGRPTVRDRQVVQSALESLGVSGLGERSIGGLSDGERQRVMVARALAQEPAVLLLDEPTAFLDVPSRIELLTAFHRLARRHRSAVIVATHELDLALRVADRVWLVANGTLLDGVPEDVVWSGAIGRAFDRPGWCVADDGLARGGPPDRGPRAVVTGRGPRATLARAVLQRHGFAVADDRSAAAVAVDVGDASWRCVHASGHASGESFGALDAHVRALPLIRSEERL